MDLFNNVLTEKADIEQLIKENNITNVSTGLPGLIIQAYLVLVRLFDLNVMGQGSVLFEIRLRCSFSTYRL